jgi:hypothetical protein
VSLLLLSGPGQNEPQENTMKKSIRSMYAVVLIGAAATFGSLASAQETVTQTTTSTSADGTITEFTPGGDTVVLKSETSTEPVRYSYSKQTTIVDENGNPVDISVVKSGVPVHVFYDRDGDRMVARRIVVRRATTTAPDPGTVIRKDTTTTTTTQDR